MFIWLWLQNMFDFVRKFVSVNWLKDDSVNNSGNWEHVINRLDVVYFPCFKLEKYSIAEIFAKHLDIPIISPNIINTKSVSSANISSGCDSIHLQLCNAANVFCIFFHAVWIYVKAFRIKNNNAGESQNGEAGMDDWKKTNTTQSPRSVIFPHIAICDYFWQGGLIIYWHSHRWKRC